MPSGADPSEATGSFTTAMGASGMEPTDPGSTGTGAAGSAASTPTPSEAAGPPSAAGVASSVRPPSAVQGSAKEPAGPLSRSPEAGLGIPGGSRPTSLDPAGTAAAGSRAPVTAEPVTSRGGAGDANGLVAAPSACAGSASRVPSGARAGSCGPAGALAGGETATPAWTRPRRLGEPQDGNAHAHGGTQRSEGHRAHEHDRASAELTFQLLDPGAQGTVLAAQEPLQPPRVILLHRQSVGWAGRPLGPCLFTRQQVHLPPRLFSKL